MRLLPWTVGFAALLVPLTGHARMSPTTTTSHSEWKRVSGGTGREGSYIPVGCTPSSTEKANIDEVYRQLNSYRRSKGKVALTYSTRLQGAMEGHCHHMAVHAFFSHYAPESGVRTPWRRAELCGTSASGENIAAGYSSPSSVMSGWKSSSGHNANMLNGSFRRVGCGYYYRSGSPYGRYWGQLFGY